MKIQFNSLFDVEILHNYYQSGHVQNLDIIPSVTCQRLLTNFGLLFKKTSKGFTVLYEIIDESNGDSHPLKPITENVRFTFLLQSRNPYLVNFSDLPLQTPANHLFYLNNMNNNPQNSKLLLSAKTSSEFVSSEDNLEFEPLIFHYQAASSSTSVNVKINDQWSNTVTSETVAIVEGKLNFEVDLRRHGPGKFSLWVDDVEKKTFYASDELVGKNVFGLIDIFRDDRVPEDYQFTDPDNNHDVLAKTFTAKIDNRRTFWKYYVVLKYRTDIDPEDLSIEFLPQTENDNDNEDDTDSGNGDFTTPFERKPPIERSDGLMAIPFISQAVLPLQENPIKKIQLKKTSSISSGIFSIKNLTNPSVATIIKSDADQFLSEIFIYV
jgi:hypothetical protein